MLLKLSRQAQFFRNMFGHVTPLIHGYVFSSYSLQFSRAYAYAAPENEGAGRASGSSHMKVLLFSNKNPLWDG